VSSGLNSDEAQRLLAQDGPYDLPESKTTRDPQRQARPDVIVHQPRLDVEVERRPHQRRAAEHLLATRAPHRQGFVLNLNRARPSS